MARKNNISSLVDKALLKDDYRQALDDLITKLMARKNKKGTSFLSLDLEQDEEKKLKAYLGQKKISGKKYLRYLVRTDLKINIKLTTQ